MTLINQDGKELFFDAEKFSVKLQVIGIEGIEENPFNFCAVSIQQARLMPRPLAVGIYRSRKTAEMVARELRSASKTGKPYFVMPPTNITALELFERIVAIVFDESEN